MEFSVSAPGKIVLFGEHMKGPENAVISTTVSLRTSAYFQVIPLQRAKARDSIVLTIVLEDLGVSTEYTAEQIVVLKVPEKSGVDMTISEELKEGVKQLPGSLTGSVEAIVYLFVTMLSNDRNPMENQLQIIMNSDLPMGSGLGASSAFSVTIVTGLLFYFGLLNQETSKDALSVKDLKLIQQWSQLAEHLLRSKSDEKDGYLAVYGKSTLVVGNELTQLNTPQFDALLVHSGVHRLSKQVTTAFNDRYEAGIPVTDRIIEAMASTSDEFMTLFQSYERKEIGMIDFYVMITDLLEINQGLMNAMDIGHYNLDRICWIAKSFEIHGKSIGGGGSFVLLLFPPGFGEMSKNELVRALDEEGFESLYIILGGPGVRIHRSGAQRKIRPPPEQSEPPNTGKYTPGYITHTPAKPKNKKKH